jgi:phosphate uptake regulator
MERDADKAMAIVKRDRKLNRQYRKFRRGDGRLSSQSVVEIPTICCDRPQPERIGDRTTNMAERTVSGDGAVYRSDGRV